MSAGRDVLILIGADTSGLNAALSSAKGSVNAFKGEVQSSLSSMSSAFASVNSAFASMGAILGGGAILGALTAIGAAIDKFGGRATEISTMAATLGVTTSQFQAMQVVANETGVSMTVVERGTEKLTNALFEARQGSAAAITNLKNLGVTNEQIASPTFTIADLLQTLHGRLNDTNTAAGTQSELLKELGVRGAQFAEWVKAADLSELAVTQSMAKVNGLTEAQIADLKASYAVWKSLGEAIANTFSKGLIEATKFYNFVKDHMPAAWIAAMKPTEPPVSELARVGTIDRGQGAGGGSADSGAQIASSHAVTAVILQDLKEQVAATQSGTAERVAAAQSYYNAVKQYFAGTAEKTETAAAHAALLADEREYQAKRIALQNEATAAIRASTGAALREATRAIEESTKALDAMVEDAKGDYKAQEDAALGGIERQIEGIHAQASAGRISNSEELADTKALLAQMWADEQAYYAKLRALDIAAGTSTKAVDDQEAAAHQKYLTELQKADEKYESQTNAEWKSLGTSMQTSFAANLTAMIERTKTFQQAVRSLFSTLIDGLIQLFVKMAIQWVLNQVLSATASKTAGVSTVAANAAMAATAAMASVAAIPFYGWAAAPAVGATTFAEAMAYDSALSAQGGYDIPTGINPLLQAHGGEMVLPQSLGDVVRRAAGGGSGGGSGDTHFHMGVSAMDARSFESYFKSPGGRKLISETMMSAYRRGTKGTRR